MRYNDRIRWHDFVVLRWSPCQIRRRDTKPTRPLTNHSVLSSRPCVMSWVAGEAGHASVNHGYSVCEKRKLFWTHSWAVCPANGTHAINMFCLHLRRAFCLPIGQCHTRRRKWKKKSDMLDSVSWVAKHPRRQITGLWLCRRKRGEDACLLVWIIVIGHKCVLQSDPGPKSS